MSHYYEVQAARTQQDVEDGQCDVIDVYDTKREAVERARYLLTDEYQRVTEMSEPFSYARVMRDGKECVDDRVRRIMPAYRYDLDISVMKILYTQPWDAERLNACVAIGFVSKHRLNSEQPDIHVYADAHIHYGATFCIPVVIQRASILKMEVLFECSTKTLEAEILAAGGPKYAVGAVTRAALAEIRKEAKRGEDSK